jgi:hypothetical protein
MARHVACLVETRRKLLKMPPVRKTGRGISKIKSNMELFG